MSSIERLQESFFDTNSGHIKELYALLNMECWTGKLTDTVEQTQPWVRGDHAMPEVAVIVDDDKKNDVTNVLGKMGLLGAKAMQSTATDVWVLGGMHVGNVRRMDFAKESLDVQSNVVGNMVLLGGERPVYEGDRAAIEKNLQEIGSKGDWYTAKRANNPAAITESDMMLLAAIRSFGAVEIDEQKIMDNGIKARSLWVPEYPNVTMTLVHTDAVERTIGVNRHTTESCVRDVLTLTPLADNPIIVSSIAANPHIERTARSAQRVADKQGRTDVHISGAGPSVANIENHRIVLGELARLLYEDLLISRK